MQYLHGKTKWNKQVNPYKVSSCVCVLCEASSSAQPVSARRLFLLYSACQLFILPPSWCPHVSHEASCLSPSPPLPLWWISFSFLLHHPLRMTFVFLHILLLSELISWLVVPGVSHSWLFRRHKFLPGQYFSQFCIFLMFISQFKSCMWSWSPPPPPPPTDQCLSSFDIETCVTVVSKEGVRGRKWRTDKSVVEKGKSKLECQNTSRSERCPFLCICSKCLHEFGNPKQQLRTFTGDDLKAGAKQTQARGAGVKNGKQPAPTWSEGSWETC